MKNVYLVIQGHTRHCDDVLSSVKNIKNVIWSTDSDSPEHDLAKIRRSNVALIENDKVHPGFGNINLQIKSTVAGLNRAKSLGATHAIKIRSDMVLSDAQRFIDNIDLASDKIYHLTYVNHIDSNLSLPREKAAIDQWISYYQIPMENLSSYNCVTDFMNYGPIDEMIDFWDYPFEDGLLPVPAEHKLMFRYLLLKNKQIDMSYDNLSKIFGFFLTQLRDLEITLFTLKWGYDYSQLGTGYTNRDYLG